LKERFVDNKLFRGIFCANKDVLNNAKCDRNMHINGRGNVDHIPLLKCTRHGDVILKSIKFSMGDRVF
jgi:hypothetical protein